MKVFGIVGWKNSGKTTLMERLIAEITARGFSVSTLKHAHHDTDIDQPGRDSHRHRTAGAREVLLGSRHRWALMHELREAPEPRLAELLSRFSPVDLVLIEGFKAEPFPKIELCRAATGRDPVAARDPDIRAVASDRPLATDLPRLDLDDIAGIADFILRETGLRRADAASPHCGAPALPTNEDWTPVDQVLAQLRAALSPVEGTETLPLAQARHRILATDAFARRANPPAANSAVDGYGFAHGAAGAAWSLPLFAENAMAGRPFRGDLPSGSAIRILTGAIVPAGVDTIVLEENVLVDDQRISLRGPVRKSGNIRPAGEDLETGALALRAPQRLRAPDIALLSAVGLCEVEVFRPLRVAVMSIGDEIAPPGTSPSNVGDTLPPERIYDANRPMLLALAEGWDYCTRDFGGVGDGRADLARYLDRAAGEADVIVTSGGASASDQDHVAALLREEGRLSSWRVAMKPGRRIALGAWRGVPVFGLPGNPAAALVAALIFLRPALGLIAGAGWRAPEGFDVPAAFAMTKRAGRRDFLRARLTPCGQAELFPSEGSGRTSGLSWAEGLVELSEAAREIRPGDPVRFLPYSAFGL